MKKIWNYVKWHFINDFHPWQYLMVLLFLIVCVSLNYTFDFEDTWLEQLRGYPKLMAYFLFYSAAYFCPVAAFARYRNKMGLFRQADFWWKSVFGILVLSIDSSAFFLQDLVQYVFHPATQFWGFKVAINGMSFLTVFIPILVFYRLRERQDTSVYGLRARAFDTRPYFTMLAMMLPVIIAASFNESFLRQYPMYRTSAAHLHLSVPEWVTAAAYEIAYGMDFITVEFLFRGFFVVGMAALLGRGAVLSMAVLYCFLHFGKPAGEAISSVFGGYILGVVAYETRSVWGGVIVHMGIAWTMELVAYVQKALSA